MVDREQFEALEVFGQRFNALLLLLAAHFESTDRFRNPGDPHRTRSDLLGGLNDLQIDLAKLKSAAAKKES